MSTITTELARLFDTVQRPGDFFATGSTEIFSPSLEVEGIGPIALPLLSVQAEQLIAVAEQAPYGRGEETLVDTAVRRTWQIDAARIRIGGRHWPRDLETIVKKAAAGLGVTQPVVAELYKLLVYDQGSFFVSHRDTEKAPTRDVRHPHYRAALPLHRRRTGGAPPRPGGSARSALSGTGGGGLRRFLRRLCA